MKKNKKRRQNCLEEWKREYISKCDQVIQKFPSCFAISEFIFISLSLKTALAEPYGYIMPLLLTSNFCEFLQFIFFKVYFQNFQTLFC